MTNEQCRPEKNAHGADTSYWTDLSTTYTRQTDALKSEAKWQALDPQSVSSQHPQLFTHINCLHIPVDKRRSP